MKNFIQVIPSKERRPYAVPECRVTELFGTPIMAISQATTENYTEKRGDSFFYEEPASDGGNFFIDF